MSTTFPDKLVSELHSFAERIGMETLELNEEGYCALESDKGEVLHLQWEGEEQGYLELSAPVSRLSGDAAADGLRLLLEANFAKYGSGGGWFAIRPGSDEIWYFYRLELNLLSAEMLETVLAGCLEKLTQWREQLAQPGASEQVSDDNPAPTWERV